MSMLVSGQDIEEGIKGKLCCRYIKIIRESCLGVGKLGNASFLIFFIIYASQIVRATKEHIKS